MSSIKRVCLDLFSIHPTVEATTTTTAAGHIILLNAVVTLGAGPILLFFISIHRACEW